MQITCENCRTKFDYSSHNESSGACPYCAHLNHPDGGERRMNDSRTRDAASAPSAASPAGRETPGVQTMIYPPEAQTRPDPDTSIRQATQGRQPSLPTDRSYQLEIVEGDGIGTRFAITTPTVVVGRGGTAGLKLKDPEVSREHCVIEAYGPTLIIKDLGSANGTVLNGFLVRNNLLKHHDRIHVGNTTLEVHQQGRGASTKNGGKP